MSAEGRTITLTQEGEWWVAKDEEADVASQGHSRTEALENLDEALELTAESLEADTPAPEPTVPWFDTDADASDEDSQ
jgi:predicted RNase H-like HicB family nuclease